MATTQNTYTGNGSLTEYSFTFPYLEESDVKVSLDGVDQLTTAYSFANATTISFVTAPANGVAIRIYRETAQEAPPATFFAGSAIRASDLNDNFLQQLYVAQETANIAGDLTAGDIAPEAIGNVQLADNAVTAAKIADGNITSAKIADGTIVNADVNASAAIAGTKVSPDFGSQNITTTGTATLSGLIYPTSDGSADEILKTNGSGTLSFGTILTVPVGAVFHFAASTAPTGYLKANGDTIPNGSGTVQGVTANFSALYAVIGSTYGSAGQLPDLRGEFLRGWDDSAGVDSGRTFGSSQTDSTALPNNPFGTSNPGDHSHSYDRTGENNANRDPGGAVTNQGAGGSSTSGGGAHTHTINGGDPETRPRNVALLACIKY